MRGESWADTVILAREVEVLESVPIGDFGVDPGDSAALLRLREAIDEHLPHYEPEHTDGDYDGVVRVAGRELTVTWEQETARLRERVRVLEAAQQWRPLTATESPKLGALVLMVNEHGDLHQCRFRAEHGYGASRWTHWLPLPDPPGPTAQVVGSTPEEE